MAQFSALLYKNLKIIVRQWPTTLLQILSPLFCIGFVVILQYVAQNRANTIDIKPPFEIPFGGLFPINLPFDLIRAKDLGFESCLRNNKYAFTSETTSDDVTFVDKYIGFSRMSGIRNFVCYDYDHRATMSPSFSRTTNATADSISREILDEMEHFYGTKIPQVKSSQIPTDGFYLFSEANLNRVAGTIFSNNFNVQYFHRDNGQTMLNFHGFLVSSPDSPAHRRLHAPPGLHFQRHSLQRVRT